MNKKNRKKYGRRLALAVFVAAAGFSYSCGAAGKGELLSAAEGSVQKDDELQMLTGPDSLDDSEVLPGQGVLDDSEVLLGQSGLGDSEALSGQSVPGDSGALPGRGVLGESETSTGPEILGTSCFVHVCGQVKEPGVYELKEGQRVFEAIEMAGGFCDNAAEDYLNLAEPVWDGMRLEVPDREQVPDTEWEARTGVQAGGRREGGQSGSHAKAGALLDGGTGSSSGKVNLNTATKEELMTLRGIGEARAEDIIRYREEQGGFGRIEDIMEISGIKDAAFQKIKDDIIV